MVASLLLSPRTVASPVRLAHVSEKQRACVRVAEAACEGVRGVFEQSTAMQQ